MLTANYSEIGKLGTGGWELLLRETLTELV